ncbi:hypothetical protein AnigIFM63604_003314 [Aspergillus niger]|uniref:Uncharacterized protein n=1 Tax=Aspergillus niger TaxID=5061 RepID=A0A9W6AEU3_ASPNG|nr:hypothetical protein AnigIFM63604_003314 [Aspergillus niger]
MSRPAERPATPSVPSTPLQGSHPSILSDSSDSESDPLLSTSECPDCRLPSVPELSTLAAAIPQLDLNTSATLEEQFLETLAIHSAVGSTRAAAVVPQDRRAAGHYVLIDLLCHRMFSTVRHQGGIRNFSVYYYARFLPGDTLTAVSRRVFRRHLSWLEATVARDSVVVATATALYDAAGLELEEGKQIPTDELSTDFENIHSSTVFDELDLW